MNASDEPTSIYTEPQAGGLILHQAIIFSIMCICLIIVVAFPDQWKNQCIGLGGRYWEIANVTCAWSYSNCFSMCDLNGQTYNYYDGDLCVLDCEYKNKQNSEVRCVC